MDRESSPAFAVLRASSKRLLLFIEGEIARQGGGPVTLRMDELQVVGSRNVVLPGLSELHGLGLIDWRRSRYSKRHLIAPKRHLIALSDRWRAIETPKHARIVSAVARVQLPVPSTAASTAPRSRRPRPPAHH